ncbi:hypothetical protein [Arcobacter porcinus]|uniref:Uncharacterized protein n=1 Tax=Arcobacter porcinus TaxID=1935204 RepID=A0A5C2HC79_9BACT|nr:hypothetical protein [Arcobacter porcinus]OCL97196.1 hypothetical protein AAX27_00103 [Aliarcobacter thereius]QEP39804.1 hypothetical protein APORC_0165 [Arcobacter porcinus]
MKIFDKATWHIDAGENKDEVIQKFKKVFYYLNTHNLLSKDGKEIIDLNIIDSSISLNSKLLTENAIKFLEIYYDKVIKVDTNDIEMKLDFYYKQFLEDKEN